MFDMTFPDFDDKIVLFYLTGRSDDQTVVLAQASFANLGGRIYVVGEIADGTTANDWAAGIQTGVAWDQVEQYFVFDSLDHYFTHISLGWDEKTLQ